MTEKKSISHFFKPGIVLVLGIWMLLGIQTTVYAEESGDDGAVVAYGWNRTKTDQMIHVSRRHIL